MRSKKLKDITNTIDLKTANKILVEATSEQNKVGFELVAEYEGGLLDNYCFINYNYLDGSGVELHIKDGHHRAHKPRHYIIIKEKFLTTQSSEQLEIETDDDNLYKEFLKNAENRGEVYN